MNHRKISQILQPGFQLYFGYLIVFTVVTAFFSLPVAAVEAVCIVILACYDHQNVKRRRKEVTKYIESITGNIDVAAKDTMVNAPLPMVIFRPESGDIIWSNELFLQLAGDREHLFDAKLSSVVPEFDTRWLMEGKNECPTEVTFGSHRFKVFGHLVRTGDKSGGFLANTYWVNVTELSQIRDRHQQTRPVIAVLLLDNYDDLMKNLSDNESSALTSEIDNRLGNWMAGTGALLRRYQRERYIMVFEERNLQQFIKKKFDILDTIHEVRNPSGINASISIGIGKDGESFQELMQFANLSIEMALSRGGDQAVIRNKFSFEFYGGRASETEKRTKVKSRVMANALSALLSDASQVFVMGHKFPDMDATGAAVGVCAAARKKGVPAYIIKENTGNPSKPLIEKLLQQPEYHSNFISEQEALEMMDHRTLVVVVDTNRPEQVQAPELLEACSRVAVIDHHRRAATYIQGAALNYHEPYASSASELVSELLQYIVEPADLLRVEAEALLAGIVLDTKNFTLRTGGRTFEAAAFLRRSGADTNDVKRLFQNNLAETLAKYDIIQAAKLYHEHIAVAVVDHAVGRVTAAQAADELLNIVGIQSSFVLFPDGERVIVSARSTGDTNVQVILETLGGGGNAAVAGAQVSGMKLEEVATRLVQAIDQYVAEQTR